MTDLLDQVAAKHRNRPSDGLAPLRSTWHGTAGDDGGRHHVSDRWSYTHAGKCWDRPEFMDDASSWVRSSVQRDDQLAFSSTLSSLAYTGLKPGEKPSDNWKRSGSLVMPPETQQLYENALKSLPYVGLQSNDGVLNRLEFDGCVQLGRTSMKKWNEFPGPAPPR